ncbi:MAG: hypothetical protein PHW04_13555 [Candidatus Wallbacteria bacterium]|nr:hypothetical protein [Candidatus Wallbacteria bacterium]
MLSERTAPGTDWDRKVQVISCSPQSENAVGTLKITLNGLLKCDKTDPQKLHRQGMLSVQCLDLCSVDSLELETSGTVNFDLVSICSRDLYGNRSELPVPIKKESGSLVTILNPLFSEYLLNQAGKYIRSGVDAVCLLNTGILGSAVSTRPGSAGFSSCEISAFEQHLLEIGFKNLRDYVTSVCFHDRWPTAEVLLEHCSPGTDDDFEVTGFLRSTGEVYAPAREIVFNEYRKNLENLYFRETCSLIAEIRKIAIKSGGNVKILASIPGLGGHTGISPLQSLVFAPLLDGLIYELDLPLPADQMKFHFLSPGKFAASYKLGRAVTDGINAALPGEIYHPYLSRRGSYSNYLKLMFCEAASCQSSLILPDFPSPTAGFNGLEQYTAFVRDNRWIYEGSTCRNRLAVLYSNQSVLQDPDAHFSYLGISQALTELNLQFDTIYSTDERFSRDELLFLGSYECLIVPSSVSLTKNQYQALHDFLLSGKKVFFTNLREERFKHFKNALSLPDLGLSYLEGDRAAALQEIKMSLWDAPRPYLTVSARDITVFRHFKPDLNSLCVHFLNYQYNPDSDSCACRNFLQAEIELPDYFCSCWKVEYYRPESLFPEPLPFTREGNLVKFTLPSLNLYGVAVISLVHCK